MRIAHPALTNKLAHLDWAMQKKHPHEHRNAASKQQKSVAIFQTGSNFELVTRPSPPGLARWKGRQLRNDLPPQWRCPDLAI